MPSSCGSTPRTSTTTSGRAPGSSSATCAPGGPGVRMDSHLFAGYEVPPYYDSLLGKLIVWGRDRESAIDRARAALDELVIDGLVTNMPIHRALLRNEVVPRRPDDHEPARSRRAARRSWPPPSGGEPADPPGSCSTRCRPARTVRRDEARPVRLGRTATSDRAPIATPAGDARDRPGDDPHDPRDRGAHPASLAVPARRPDRRVRPRGVADRRAQGRHRDRVVLPGPLSRACR